MLGAIVALQCAAHGSCMISPAVYELTKRLIDLVISAAILVLLSPVWILAAAGIRLTSPGPALFKRTVVGKAGQKFNYYKFRTMREGDDSHHREWLHDFVTRDRAYSGGEFKVKDDPRVTRFGRLLRRTSLDEVPQLINVLKGDMSIVGPRPPIEYEYGLYDAPSGGSLLSRGLPACTKSPPGVKSPSRRCLTSTSSTSRSDHCGLISRSWCGRHS
jgi:lipopolysaccharide/colanic/teichoic acid biosynthesis glycosyltransferase